MKIQLKPFIPHIIVFLLFVAASLAYFHPVLEGKKMIQSDIVQYTGMAKKQNDFRAQTGEELLWTDTAFGGMPTYLLGARYPYSFIKKLDRTLRFLPRPADYLFLYFIGMYILFMVLKIDYKFAFFGALAFGFSTYLVIILGVGHNAKAHAIAYFPFVLSGIILAFQRKYVWGFLLTVIAMSLQIMTSHPQMTYYLMLLVIIMGLVYLYEAYKREEVPHFFKTVGILFVAVFLAIGINAPNLMATKQYADWSMRGKTELTINADGSPRETQGLSKEYITEYSYGKLESFNVMVPRLMGGAGYENLGTDSKSYEFLIRNGIPHSQASQIVTQLPTYWGDQPIVAAPAYIGAVIIFLAILGLFLVHGRAKWWLLGGIIMSLLLSWGKNFSFLTDLMLNYFPLYDKFRAVSSIQVILELCIPILGVLALTRICNGFENKEDKKKAILYTTGILTSILIIFIVFKDAIFSFTGVNDAYYEARVYGPEFMKIIKEDRVAIFNQDIMRSLILILLTAGLLYAYVIEKLKENLVLVVLTGLLLFDLVGVNLRYVGTENFVTEDIFDQPFVPLEVDRHILKDSGHFRVFEPRLRMANSRTSFFHNAIGGYHAAKPRRFQELYDFYLSNNHQEVQNMLNVRYRIKDLEGEQDERGAGAVAIKNPFANGNAWFVQNIKTVSTANKEMEALDDLKSKQEVVIRASEISSNLEKAYAVDSLAKITLVKYRPDDLVYESENAHKGFAVFSEVHYPHGWNAYVDGNLVDHYRVNYVLRGLQIPAGKHKIEFKFEPTIISKGIKISLASTAVFLLLFIGGLYLEFKNKKDKTTVS